MLSRSSCEGMTQTKPEAFDRISMNILDFLHERIYKGGMKSIIIKENGFAFTSRFSSGFALGKSLGEGKPRLSLALVGGISISLILS